MVVCACRGAAHFFSFSCLWLFVLGSRLRALTSCHRHRNAYSPARIKWKRVRVCYLNGESTDWPSIRNAVDTPCTPSPHWVLTFLCIRNWSNRNIILFAFGLWSVIFWFVSSSRELRHLFSAHSFFFSIILVTRNDNDVGWRCTTNV